MKTQIVYVVIGDKENYYVEESFLSISSLRLYNPDAVVTLLVDNKTALYIKTEWQILIDLINNLKIIDVPDSYTPKEISRYIKTSVRFNVEGDYLFLDTDTIITCSLDGVDHITGDINCVLDHHLDFQRSFVYDKVCKKLLDVFQVDVSNATKYFNSGVMLVKDNEFAHKFYKCWHENWQYANNKNVVYDQIALIKTDYDFDYAIKEMDGAYNSQVLTSIEYMSSAKILHFFQTNYFPDFRISPFVGEPLYKKIREEHGINGEIIQMIGNVKNLFPSPSFMIGYNEFAFLTSDVGKLYRKLYEKNSLLNKIFSLFSRCLNTK